MSVEIANVVHAMAFLNLANVPADQILVKGFGIASVTRADVGVYVVTLQTPLDFDSGIAQVSHAAATARIVVAQLQPLEVRPRRGQPADQRLCADHGFAPPTPVKRT